MPSRPMHGTKPASRTAGRRSKTRLGCAKGPPGRCISLIFAIPMATNYARSVACLLPELSQVKPEEGRPFRAVLARERTWLGPIGRAPHELTFGIRRGAALAGAGDCRRPPPCISGFGADSGAKPRRPPAHNFGLVTPSYSTLRVGARSASAR